MGKIKGSDKDVVVEFDVSELIRQRVYLKVPDSPPPPGFSIRINDWVGNMISRAAWAIIVKKAKTYVKEYDAVDVTGGKITVRFYNKE